uniref:Uncharacterized protein n=1 Tax=Tanacetum cinerariifolium TaxID=118510 RepID=A0A6L2J6I5_TANCI|nr:hypothetical protein [Tanacetum cinerariifolium]
MWRLLRRAILALCHPSTLREVKTSSTFEIGNANIDVIPRTRHGCNYDLGVATPPRYVHRKTMLRLRGKKGNNVVKKELIVAMKGEFYFAKFIINTKEDDVEPGVILGRLFMRLAKGIVDFSNGMITIYPKPDPFEDDSEKTEKSSDAGDHLTQEEAAKEAFLIRNSQKFALLEEVRPIIETMAYHDKYKKNLDEIWKDKVELDGKIVKEEEEAVKRIKGIAESDSDDEEEYQIKRNKFGAPIYVPKHASYLKCNDPADRSLAIQTVTNIFCKISVWKKTMGTHDDEAGSSRSKRSTQHKTVEEVLRLQVHHEFLLWEGCSREAKSRYNTILANFLPRYIYSPCVVKWDVLNRIGCDVDIDDMLRIRLREAGSDEEIFTSVA